MLKFSNEINGMHEYQHSNKKNKVVDAATFLDEFKTMKSSSFFAVPFLFIFFYFFSKLTALQKLFSLNIQ